MTSRLADLVADWAAADPDPVSAAALHQAWRDRPDEVAGWFDGRLTFGTAGLRGPMGAGPTQMNRVIVRVAAAALCDVVLEEHPDSQPLVVIGHDARHGSREFALDSARVLLVQGVDVAVVDGPIPTPVLAHQVLRTGAAAGVMVTASHNPPADNGYKVYWSDAAQIGPAVADRIEAAMDRPLLTERDLATHDWVRRRRPAEVIDEYLDAVLADRAAGAAPPPFAYTALHGVGAETTRQAVARLGWAPAVEVASQNEPDPDFPTVELPNPEEAGALDEAMATADAADVSLIVAHDPDADRLGVAVRTSEGWRRLHGDEIGALLGDHLLRRGDGDSRVVACSLVSSPMLDLIAEGHGVASRRTSTGFKWIIRPAIDEPSLDYVFGYEEALGYACHPAVRDKDGITAMVELLTLAGELAADGHTLLDRLVELGDRHGHVATGQVTLRFDDRSRLPALMAELRFSGPPAGLAVTETIDHLDSTPPTDLLEWRTEGGSSRILLRASGTEPKLKAYLHVLDAPDADTAVVRRAALEQMVRSALA